MVEHQNEAHDTRVDGKVKVKKRKKRKKHLFKLSAMNKLVDENSFLKNKYDKLSAGAEEKLGYHWNEVVQNILFNKYVKPEETLMGRYLEIKRRDEAEHDEKDKASHPVSAEQTHEHDPPVAPVDVEVAAAVTPPAPPAPAPNDQVDTRLTTESLMKKWESKIKNNKSGMTIIRETHNMVQNAFKKLNESGNPLANPALLDSLFENFDLETANGGNNEPTSLKDTFIVASNGQIITNLDSKEPEFYGLVAQVLRDKASMKPQVVKADALTVDPNNDDNWVISGSQPSDSQPGDDAIFEGPSAMNRHLAAQNPNATPDQMAQGKRDLRNQLQTGRPEAGTQADVARQQNNAAQNTRNLGTTKQNSANTQANIADRVFHDERSGRFYWKDAQGKPTSTQLTPDEIKKVQFQQAQAQQNVQRSSAHAHNSNQQAAAARQGTPLQEEEKLEETDTMSMGNFQHVGPLTHGKAAFLKSKDSGVKGANVLGPQKGMNEGEAKPAALVQLDRLHKETEKASNGYYKKEQKERNLDMKTMADGSSVQQHDYEKDSMDHKDVPMHHPSKEEEKYVKLNRGGNLADRAIQGIPDMSKDFKDRMKDEAGADVVKDAEDKAKEIAKVKPALAPPMRVQTVNEGVVLTARYMTPTQRSVIAFNTAKAEKINALNEKFTALETKGFGNDATPGAKTIIAENDFFIDLGNNQVYVLEKKAGTLNESVSLKKNEYDRLRKLITYNPGTWSGTR